MNRFNDFNGSGPGTEIPCPQTQPNAPAVRACGTRDPVLQCPPSARRTGFECGTARKVLRRSEMAKARAVQARDALANCHLCAHHCGVNRLKGETGLCHAGAGARFFSAQVEVGDELELIPTFAVALSGCDLRCEFCVTGAASWNAKTGVGLQAVEMAERAQHALARGARTVMVLGGEPTIHLPAALELVAALPDSARLIWKTNAHGTAQARAFLAGMFDVWLADFKFGNDACARRLAKAPDYLRVVRENLLWFADQGPTERRSPLRGELIVRHLLMPGHVECCWRPVAAWLAAHLPGVKVSLRTGFWPGWHAARQPELRRTVDRAEAAQARDLGREYCLNLIE